MAGIGFSLKRMFDDQHFSTNIKGYLYTAFVTAGPWISAVLTVNGLLFISELTAMNFSERRLFMGTIVYVFVFSQIVTAPFQLVVTRYLADSIFQKKYGNLVASFHGLSWIVFSISLLISSAFYFKCPLPLSFKFIAVCLFVIVSLMWVVMIYLSAIKNYALISWAYVAGGGLSALLAWVTSLKPVPFVQNQIASNLLLSFLLGMMLSFIILYFAVWSYLPKSNRLFFDFLRYFSFEPKLAGVGFFYTLGLWSHNFIIWFFSDIGESVRNIYRLSSLYDQAIFLAFLTAIPTTMLFVVSVETEFYLKYREFYGMITSEGTMHQLIGAKKEMKNSLYRQLFFVFESQAIITITIIGLSGKLFSLFNGSMIVRNLFRILALGAFLNMFVFLMILILLYFQANSEALIVASTFFLGNVILTYIFLPFGLARYGIGFFISSVLSLVLSIVLTNNYIKNLERTTYLKQSMTEIKEKGLFYKIALFLNRQTKGFEAE